MLSRTSLVSISKVLFTTQFFLCVILTENSFGLKIPLGILRPNE